MRIAIITGSRGDHGALSEVHRALGEAGHAMRWIDVRPSFGRVTYQSDAAQMAGIACSTVAGDLACFETDLVVLLGDRSEIAGAALGANIMGVPIAHLSGGDLTEGSQDDCFRHSITKLSHLHFPTNKPAARRIHQMGEDVGRITVAGWPCLDRMCREVLEDREKTFKRFGFASHWRAILACLHPDTLGDTHLLAEATGDALWAIQGHPGIALVLIGPNNDPGNEHIREVWARMASSSPKAVYRETIDQVQFWALMSHCDVMVGNSSAGYYEAPSMAIPVVDIGDRQRGRIPTSLLFNVPVDAKAIQSRIELLLEGEIKVKIPTENPYGDGFACKRIVERIGAITDPKALLRKTWRPNPEENEHGSHG